MTICPQCNGKKGTVGQQPVIDKSSNTESFQAPASKPGAILCTQCGGVGYY